MVPLSSLIRSGASPGSEGGAFSSTRRHHAALGLELVLNLLQVEDANRRRCTDSHLQATWEALARRQERKRVRPSHMP